MTPDDLRRAARECCQIVWDFVADPTHKGGDHEDCMCPGNTVDNLVEEIGPKFEAALRRVVEAGMLEAAQIADDQRCESHSECRESGADIVAVIRARATATGQPGREEEGKVKK